MNTYECSKCKLAVIVLPNEIIKACKCEFPIVANMVATVPGKSTFIKTK